MGTKTGKWGVVLNLVVLLLIWVVAWVVLHGELYQPWLDGHYSAATSFILWIVISFVATAIFEIGFFIFLVKKEKITNFRQYFKIETLDVKGIWLCFGLGIGLQIINFAFLNNLLLEPARNFLSSLGLGGSRIGLGTSDIVPLMSPTLAIFLTIFLLAFWWLEVPEELFFRGYIQNKLQGVVGKNKSMWLSAIIWDIAHVFGLVSIVERFFYGLLYAFVFRVRQNTTATMLVHPISNRSLFLMAVIPQIWGMTVDTGKPITWLYVLVLYAAMLGGVILLWKALHLDRQPHPGHSPSASPTRI